MQSLSDSEEDVYQSFRKSMSVWFEKQDRFLNQYGDYMMLPLDIVHLTLKLSSDDRIDIRNKLELSGTALYVVSPIDILPEAFLGPIGLVDDAVIALVILRKILTETDPTILEEHWAGKRSTLYTVRAFLSLVDEIPGEQLFNQMLSALRKQIR